MYEGTESSIRKNVHIVREDVPTRFVPRPPTVVEHLERYVKGVSVVEKQMDATVEQPPPRPPRPVNNLSKVAAGVNDSALTVPHLPRPHSTSSLLFEVSNSNPEFDAFGSKITSAALDDVKDPVRPVRMPKNSSYGIGFSASTSALACNKNWSSSNLTQLETLSSTSKPIFQSTDDDMSVITLREQMNRDSPSAVKSPKDSTNKLFTNINIPSSRSPSPASNDTEHQRRVGEMQRSKSKSNNLSNFMNNLSQHSNSNREKSFGIMSKSNSSKNLPSMNSVCISVMGARRVGKTSLCQRFTQSIFEEHYDPTFTFEEYTRTLNLGPRNGGKNINVKVLDTPLESIPLKESRPFLDMANGVMLVYSVQDPDSVGALETLLDTLNAWEGDRSREAIPLLVVANKSDGIAGKVAERSRDNAITLLAGMNFAKKHRIPHMEATALSPRTTEVFSTVVHLCFSSSFK
eukprot:CFRG1268T1